MTDRAGKAGGKAWSIRKRLTRRVLLWVGLAWLVTILLGTLFIDHEINEMMDEELHAVAETTILSLDAGTGDVIPRSIAIAPDGKERVLRILRQGAPVPQAPWPALSTDGLHHLAGWRVLRVSAENAVIEVAHSDAWRREEMLEAASALLVLILPMVVVLLLGLRRSLRQGLSPLQDLSQSIEARAPSDLAAFGQDGLPAELRPLVDSLNGYIDRIEAMRQSEQRFVAHASHELRTPVAAIRARLDLSQDPQARAALPLLDSLNRRVERLLQLSRADAGLGLGRGPSDLVLILQLLIREVGHNARHPIRFDDGDLERLMVAADADAMAILIRNLLENALEHGAGRVVVRLRPTWLSISNPIVDGQLHTRPFAKREGSAGVGLGLAIIDQLSAGMGVRLEKIVSPDAIEMRVHFPDPDPQAA